MKAWRIIFVVSIAAMPIFSGPPRASAGRANQVSAEQKPSASWNRAYRSLFGLRYQRRLSARSKRWEVTLYGWKACPERAMSHECFYFDATERTTGREVRFGVENETAQVDAIALAGRSDAAILGRASSNLAVVSVVNLNIGRVADRFVCYSPQISPDDRFVVFRKWFPLRVPSQVMVSDEYLVYDLRDTPADNRPPASRGVSDIYDVGWPLYPPDATNSPGDNVLDGHNLPVHQMASDGFFWLDNDTVTFADAWKGTVSLVSANVARGIRHPLVSATSLMSFGVLNQAKCNSLSAAAFFLTQVSRVKGSPGQVCLRFRTWDPACLARASAPVELSQVTIRTP